MQEEKRNIHLSKIKPQPLEKYPNCAIMRNTTAPKHVDPEQIEKVNKTLGKNGQMQECYWRKPDKNMTGETTMQTTCSSGKRATTRQRWEPQITTCGKLLREIRERNKDKEKPKRFRCAEMPTE